MTCSTGKTIYWSRQDAERQARYSRKRTHHPDILPYRCPILPHYHIGHTRNWNKAHKHAKPL